MGLFLGFLSHDLAIDLGSANTVVAIPGRGVVLDEPSVVAVRQRGTHREVVAVGATAKEMLGRTPESITAVRPVRGGVIVDYEVAEAMLRFFIARVAGRRSLVRPRILVCVPFGVTEEQQRAARECARAAGGREVRLVYGPVAAALGAALPVEDPSGTFLCVVGAGTTEAAVLSMGAVVASRTTGAAGDAMDQALVAWLQRTHNVLVGDLSAEAIKLEVGCALEPDSPRAFVVRGRDLAAGIPRQITVTSDDARDALGPVLGQLAEAVRQTLAETPPELAADIVDAGLVVAGGGSLLWGLDAWLRQTTGLAVVRAPEPLHAVALGAASAIEEPSVLGRVAF
ncbi:MAG: rod shape-determining protein [Deltaproteobacteria bacterium]|nr:rod shape-determining protein [Deltaproteobacteria bacterium]